MVVPTRSARLRPTQANEAETREGVLVPERIALAVAASGEAAYEWDCATDALRWSAGAQAVLGCGAMADLGSGRAFAAMLDAASPQNRHDAIFGDERRDEGEGVRFEIRYAIKSGNELRWIEDAGRWYAGADGKPVRASGTIRAVTERHLRETELARLSLADPLTGDLNRLFLTRAIEEELENAQRYKTSFGFLIAGIDDLSHFNRSYGFGVGDQAIIAISERLRSRKRGNDLIGRFSDNKFAILVKDCSPDELAIAGTRFVSCVREAPFETSVGPLVLSVTAGGVVAPRYARDAGEVLAHAHEALDGAKKLGKGSFVAYQPNIENDQRRRDNLRVTDMIVAALNERRIGIAMQPIVHAASRKTGFLECLVRITDATGAPVDPQTVVEVAEQLDLVRLIDHRVLELGAAALRADPALSVSINVSAATLDDSIWMSALAAEMRDGLGPRLIVEITESAAIRDVEATRRFVAHVQSKGCRVAIDDFGAGYSSFRNLRSLGVDMVKIDGSFIRNLEKSADDRAFVRALLQLARELGLETVGEWVQSEPVAELLREWGCDYLQGSLIGLPAERSRGASGA